jgi:hypothetical protein
LTAAKRALFESGAAEGASLDDQLARDALVLVAAQMAEHAIGALTSGTNSSVNSPPRRATSNAENAGATISTWSFTVTCRAAIVRMNSSALK